MKILIDSNVILGYLLGENGVDIIKELIRSIERHEIIGCITASAVTDIQYILVRRLIEIDRNQQDEKYQHKTRSEIRDEATNDLMEFLSIFRILSVTESDIKTAFSLKWSDFEDSVQYAVAKNMNMEMIITQNSEDFKNSDIPVMLPQDFYRTYLVS